MSDLEDPFLQQIARQPHDWLPRLIFADWLEEQGDPRGELIRLTHQLTRLDCEQRQQKETRLQELSTAGIVWPSPSPVNSLSMPLVLIPPGQFRMGSPKSEPCHGLVEMQVDVTLTQGFWLGQYTVTQAEYQAVTGTNPSWFNQERLKSDSSRHPVETVSWYEAMEFCNKLTALERAVGCLPANWEYTLPTEAQWEYACRAGTTTATAFGDSLGSTQANIRGSQPYNGAAQGEDKGQTVEVGSYPSNLWNLYDMHGNVYEWCWNSYSERMPGGTDPKVQIESAYRMARGGGWCDPGECGRSAHRDPFTPDSRQGNLGFRLTLAQVRSARNQRPWN